MVYRQHKCDDIPEYVLIERLRPKISKHISEIQWFLTIDFTEGNEGVTASLKIKRCPFCGINLEKLE